MTSCRLVMSGAAVALVVPMVGHAQTASTNAVASLAQPVASDVRIDTADLVLPAAQEVIVDLPSAFHASRYQRGDVNGLRYVLFPDGSGKVMTTAGKRDVLYRLDCTNAASCIITDQAGAETIIPAVGGPKPALPASPSGEELARHLAAWLVAGTGEKPHVDVVVIAEEGPVLKDTVQAVVPDTEANAVTTRAVVTPLSEPEATPEVQEQVAIASAPTVTAPKPARPSTSPRTSVKPVRTSTKAFKASQPVAAPAPKPPVKTVETVQKRDTLFERLNLSCSITGSVTLRYKHPETGAENFGKPRASLGCGARLSEKLSLRVSMIGYVESGTKSPSDAEFTYAFSYRATDKLTLGYSNYSGRYSDSGGAFKDSLTDGTFTANYRLPKIKLPNDKTIGCSAGLGIAKPEDTRASLNCSYALTKKIRISASAFAYLPGKQDNWDPDFSYTASYRISDDWSVSYSNYANNRFFWNKTSGQEGFLNGTVSMSYRFKF